MAAHSTLVARARPVGPGQLNQHSTDLTILRKKASPRCARKLKLGPLSEHLRLCHGNGKAKAVQRLTPATLRHKCNTRPSAARRRSLFAGPGVVELHSFPPKTNPRAKSGIAEPYGFLPMTRRRIKFACRRNHRRRRSRTAELGVEEPHSFLPKTSQLPQFGAVEQLSFPPTQFFVSLWLRHAVRPPVLSDRAK